MVRRGVLVILVISMLALIAILLLISFSVDNDIEENELISFSPSNHSKIPQNCSYETLTNLWNDTFIVSSDNLTIISNTTSTSVCNSYYLYKVVNDEEAFMLFGFHPRAQGVEADTVYALHGNYSSTVLNAIRALDYTDAQTGNHIQFAYSVISAGLPLLSKPRASPISDVIQASVIYGEIFEEDNLSAFFAKNLTFSSVHYYTTDVEDDTISGTVFDETILESNLFVKNLSSICVPIFKPMNTSCLENDLKVYYFVDENQCNTLLPVNHSVSCDYDENGVIGNASSIMTFGFNSSININGKELNLSENYSNLSTRYLVEIKSGNETIINFTYNFSIPLDLTRINVTMQNVTSDLGYLIINGIEEMKTVKVRKLDGDSTGVCVALNHLGSIDEISDECDGFEEVLLDCPQTSNGLKCILTGGSYIVSGISHSAVREFVLEDTDDDCIPDWNCGSWSSCVNGSRSRTCSDSACDLSDRTETETCVCQANWTCIDWSPEECPKNETQTRTCTDSRSCGFTTGRPSQSQSCEYKPLISKTLMIILLIGGAVLCVLAIVIIVISMKRSKGSHHHSSFKSGGTSSSYSGY